MKTKPSYIMIIVIITLLVGCQTTQKSFYPRRGPSGFSIDEVGTLVHIYSGGKFPMNLSSFIRGHPHNSEISGYCAVYKYKKIFNGRKQLVESQPFVFQKGNWYISFRITYPDIENLELIRKEVNLLVASFDYAAVI
jgi:hypothetical protein